jgi:hypothetical protein
VPRASPAPAPFLNLANEVVRRSEERVLLQQAVEYDGRMRTERVDYDAGTNGRQIVRTDDSVFVLGENLVEARLELEPVFVVCSICVGPSHVAEEACARVSSFRPRLERSLERPEPGVRIESAISRSRWFPDLHLQLARADRGPHVDLGFGESPEMLAAMLGINEMERSIASVEAILDERAEQPVLLVDVGEERADVTGLAEVDPGI